MSVGLHCVCTNVDNCPEPVEGAIRTPSVASDRRHRPPNRPSGTAALGKFHLKAGKSFKLRGSGRTATPPTSTPVGYWCRLEA